MKNGLIILLASVVAVFGQCSFTFDIASQGTPAAGPSCPFNNALYVDNDSEPVLTFSNADVTGTNVNRTNFNCNFNGATVYEMSFCCYFMSDISGLETFPALTNLAVSSGDLSTIQGKYITNLYALETLNLNDCTSLGSPFSVEGLTNLVSFTYQNSGMAKANIDGCVNLTNFLTGSGLTPDELTYSLTNLNVMGKSNGYADLSQDNGVPPDGVWAATNLVDKGWTLVIQWYSGQIIGWTPNSATAFWQFGGSYFTNIYPPFIKLVPTDYGSLTQLVITNQTLDGFRLAQDVTGIQNIDLRNCSIGQTDIDTLYADLVTMGISNGTLLVSGDSDPSDFANHDTLVDRGWTITGN